jgi:hypothetical protein
MSIAYHARASLPFRKVGLAIGNREGTLFWLDPWMGEQPLRMGYPSLFAICSYHMLLVASAAHERT